MNKIKITKMPKLETVARDFANAMTCATICSDGSGKKVIEHLPVCPNYGLIKVTRKSLKEILLEG